MFGGITFQTERFKLQNFYIKHLSSRCVWSYIIIVQVCRCQVIHTIYINIHSWK